MLEQDQDLSQFAEDGSFEAYIDNDGEFLVINNCRMTKAAIENKTAIFKLAGDLDPDFNEVIGLYLKGKVVRNSAGNLTAIGPCVFFIYNRSDHGDIRLQTQLRIKSAARLYYKRRGSSEIKNDKTFADLINVRDTSFFADSSSPRTGHQTQRLFLFP
ncbi:hypothetical protein GCM10023187_05280 [Nibrella viscosa]|uniref:Uncharacterized protein n=1 Tax=Nibrella viscosa TaxID=1084524 RepID=A0ABP8JVN2_9BACT